MYLLELPSNAVDRDEKLGLSTISRGGWFLRIDASSLKSLVVPLTPAELKLGYTTSDGGDKNIDPRRTKGLVFHGESGASAWVECASVGSRDTLMNVLLAWHSAGTVMSEIGQALKVERVSVEQALSKVMGRSGRQMMSYLVDREACFNW